MADTPGKVNVPIILWLYKEDELWFFSLFYRLKSSSTCTSNIEYIVILYHFEFNK